METGGQTSWFDIDRWLWEDHARCEASFLHRAASTATDQFPNLLIEFFVNRFDRDARLCLLTVQTYEAAETCATALDAAANWLLAWHENVSRLPCFATAIFFRTCSYVSPNAQRTGPPKH